MKKVIGKDALSYVVGAHMNSHAWKVREFVCGIDIDNGARHYEHEYESDVTTVMWTILNYYSGTNSPVSEYVSAEIDDDGQLVNFYIHTDLDDCESRGIRYEFKSALA